MAEQFEQPDLRSKNVGQGGRGSSYQHPHTGDLVPSVTTISGLIDKSSYLVPWSSKIAAEWVAENFDQLLGIRDPDVMVAAIKEGAEKKRNAGRDLGSLAHNTIEALCRGQRIDIPPEVAHHVAGWMQWADRYVDHFVMIEETVWSHQFQYAGTFDVLAHFKDGRNVLVDYKTGKDIYVDAIMQLNAMANADTVVTMDGEVPLPEINGLGILHLPAPVLTAKGKPSVRGSWSFRTVRKSQEDFESFLALRRAYEWEKHYAGQGFGGKQTSPIGAKP